MDIHHSPIRTSATPTKGVRTTTKSNPVNPPRVTLKINEELPRWLKQREGPDDAPAFKDEFRESVSTGQV